MIASGADDAPRRPPGTVRAPKAKRTLVLAPHQDDEVLGCGGLIASLVQAGGDVRVAFLTDGAGGVEDIDDRAAYARRRRQEAEAVAQALGFEAHFWDLPDGDLARHREALEERLATHLAQLKPELLLVTSPLEVTDDHRAAFAAVHRVLGGLRSGDELEPVARELEVLVYEINHPFDPEVLVDVGEYLPLLERAMGLYASQQERYNYWRAGLAMRRYRTLSLPPEIEAAEGYISLRLEDFTTRSPSGLIRRLGGLPPRLAVDDGPKISVIVRTLDRPALLAEALASLDAGHYRRAEIVVVNDGGRSPTLPAALALPVVMVNLPVTGGRAAAANAGVAAATGEVIAFLDDDDLAYPEHLATLAAALAAPDVRVAYVDAAVCVYELDGETGRRLAQRRLPYSRDFDPLRLAVDNYIPFNTLAFRRELLDEVQRVEGEVFDTSLPFFEDWDFLLRLARLTPFHHLPRVTCEYRHFRGAGHHVFGETPRRRGDFLEVKGRVLARHLGLENAGGEGSDGGHGDKPPKLALHLAAIVDGLRAEAVEAAEEAASERRARRRLADSLEERDRAFHALNGRARSLEGELEDLQGAHRDVHQALEAQRHQRRELEAAVAQRGEALEAAFADIERLTAGTEELQGAIAELHATAAHQHDEIHRHHGEAQQVRRELHELQSRRLVRISRRLAALFGRGF